MLYLPIQMIQQTSTIYWQLFCYMLKWILFDWFTCGGWFCIKSQFNRRPGWVEWFLISMLHTITIQVTVDRCQTQVHYVISQSKSGHRADNRWELFCWSVACALLVLVVLFYTCLTCVSVCDMTTNFAVSLFYWGLWRPMAAMSTCCAASERRNCHKLAREDE